MSEKKEMQKTAAASTVPVKVGTPGLTKLATANVSEQMAALQEMLGGSSADVEVIIAGSLPFWPAVAGAVLVGTIQKRTERATQYKTDRNPSGVVGLYTVRIEERAALAGTADGEVFEAQPGDLINVLEREVMKEFRGREGQKVAILNLGKKTSKNGFGYWDFKVLGKKRTAEQIQAASQQLMASLQAKALENGNA